MERPKAELLSPAGSLATLKAVARAGADAVYGAGERFGARAYAGNFTEEELLWAVDHLHLHGKRFYLTVNTLLKEPELAGMLYDYILPLYLHGLDGVIVQDLGVLSFLHQQFPGLELHASTQMNITGPNGARLMKDLGCSRIVPARELSFQELSKIHQQVDIEIESFVHGALCYCYSGQCLFSSMLGGRSGNRGRCAQPCRLPYQTRGREGYLLSPKDLCTIELLPEILDSGVYSLKIEGRMKQLEYAAGVTSIYREYLDRCLRNPSEPYHVAEADLKQLLDLGSRSGYTRGYYEQQNGPQMMAMEKSAHTSGDLRLQEEVRTRFADAPLQEKIKGILRLSKGFPSQLVVKWKGIQVLVEGAIPQEAKKQPLSKETVAEKIKKTGSSEFVFEELKIELEDNLFLTVGELNKLRREALEQLRQKALQEFLREMPQQEERKGTGMQDPEEHLSGLQAEHRKEHQFGIRKEMPYLAVSVQTREQLEAILHVKYIDRIYLDSAALPRETAREEWSRLADRVHRAGKILYYVMPAVLRGNTILWHEEHLPALREAGVDGFVTGSYEGLGLLGQLKGTPESDSPGKTAFDQIHTDSSPSVFDRILTDSSPSAFDRILTDSSLYVWNGRSRQAFAQAGAAETTLPLEANEQELCSRGYEGGELLLYGYLPLMVSAQCVVKNTAGCKKKNGFTQLKDRYGKYFTVQNQCTDCYNVIYNTSPLWLFHYNKKSQKGTQPGRGLDRLGVSGYRICFTTEDEAQMSQILSCYERAFLKGEVLEPDCLPKDYTNGHLKRGVE